MRIADEIAKYQNSAEDHLADSATTSAELLPSEKAQCHAMQAQAFALLAISHQLGELHKMLDDRL